MIKELVYLFSIVMCITRTGPRRIIVIIIIIIIIIIIPPNFNTPFIQVGRGLLQGDCLSS